MTQALGIRDEAPAQSRNTQDLAWMDLAACKAPGVDPEWFFPHLAGASGKRQLKNAKRTCAKCPVRDACWDHARDDWNLVGVWGGHYRSQRGRSWDR
jgi:WhiB family redox-sensing transcriptional regulator